MERRKLKMTEPIELICKYCDTEFTIDVPIEGDGYFMLLPVTCPNCNYTDYIKGFHWKKNGLDK